MPPEMSETACFWWITATWFGGPLFDYMAAGLKDGDIHPVYKALNTLDYAVGNLGGHGFNYGLDYLHNALAGAEFPLC